MNSIGGTPKAIPGVEVCEYSDACDDNEQNFHNNQGYYDRDIHNLSVLSCDCWGVEVIGKQ